MMKTLAAAAIVTFALAVPGQAQSLTGKWLGVAPGGSALGLDLTVTGSSITGTIIAIRDGQSIPIPIREATLAGATLTMLVVAGGDTVTFSGEYDGDSITLLTDAPGPALPPVVLTRVDAFPDTTLSPLATTAPATAPDGWRAHNRAATLVEEDGRQLLRIDARIGDGVIWQEGTTLRDGTIAFDVRGANRPGESFVGIAFRGTDDTTYDGVYFRPFNFRAADPGRQRAVQYISHPDFPWNTLREQHPGRYEGAITPVPDPDGWFHVRVVVDGPAIRVFVDDATTPVLTVDALTEPRGGMVGYWVGNGSSGDFANLQITAVD